MLFAYFISFFIALFAAISDIKSRKIENRYLLKCLIAGNALHVVSCLSGNQPVGLIELASGFLLPFVLLLIPYIVGAIGASDVKLLMVMGSVTGIKGIFIITVLSFVTGGISAAIILIYHYATGRYSANEIGKMTIPFALPIFISTAIVTLACIRGLI